MRVKGLGQSVLTWGTMTFGLLLMTAVPALANTTANLRISCTGTTVCTAGATSLVTTSLSGTFGLTNVGQAFTGKAFIVALDPTGSFTGTSLTIGGGQTLPLSGATFTAANGFLENVLPGTPSLNGYSFGSLASASSQALGFNPSSFLVREWQATTGYTGSSLANCCSFNFHLGTVVVAFVKDAQGNIINTPLSGSLTVPEPVSILLLGSGLAGFGFWHRKRRKDLTA